MDTQDFLQAVLGDSGHYCLLSISSESRKFRKQKFYPTIARLIDAAYMADQNEHDVYFGLATFKDPSIEKPRSAVNTLQMRAMFMDLDCGPGKEFADQPTAIAELRGFCKAAGLRKPYMVNSGRGVHVYWPLSEPVPTAEWRPVAEALKRACAVHGLEADPTCTSDASRILRVPLTHNYKGNPPLPVKIMQGGTVTPYTLGEFSAALTAFAPEAAPKASVAPLPFSTLMTADEDPMMQRMMRNRVTKFKTILTKSVEGRGCAQIKHAFENQEDLSEPLWRGALSICMPCEDAAQGAHAMSRNHPEYSREDTVEKMEGIVGPHKCSTFESLNPEGCEGCPLKGKITSPVQIGAEIEAAPEDEPVIVEEISVGSGALQEYEIPPYPKPYFRGNQGGVYVKDVDEAGDPVDMPVYENDLYYVSRIRDRKLGECIVGRVHLPMDGVREFIIPLVNATSKEDLRKALSTHGVSAIGRGWDRLMAYTNTWIQNLQTTTIADEAHAQFGWADDEFTSFVIGDREIAGDEIGYNPPSSETAWAFPAFEPAGTLEGWVEDANFYARDGLEPYQYMICMALASPLMRFMPAHAAIFDMYSDGSGHGKTTTQKVALSIFGDPGELLITAKDTMNHRLNRLENMKDIAVQFDEFTEFPTDQMSDLIYQIHGGRQKGRMSSGVNAERYRGEPWHLTVGTSSNASMLSKVRTIKSAPDAETQRVLEYHVQPHNFTTKAETDEFATRVGQNRGHAVVPFVQYIINNRETVRELLTSVQRKLDTELNLTAPNRFWSISATVTITALIIARELGLLDYDIPKLHKFAVDLIDSNRRAAVEATATIETNVNNYVNDNYGSILWIKSTEDNRGMNSALGNNGNGLDSLVVPEQQPKVRFVARYETDTKYLFLVPKPLRAWCAKNRINYDSFVKEGMAKLNGRKAKVRLSKGTKMNLPPTDVIILECAQMELPEGPEDGGAET